MHKEEDTYHRPVLLNQSIDGMNIKKDGIYVDMTFGGGGHVRASGCDMTGTLYDVINNLTDQISLQLQELGI